MKTPAFSGDAKVSRSPREQGSPMKTPYITGKTTHPPAHPVVVPVANRLRQTHPAG